MSNAGAPLRQLVKKFRLTDARCEIDWALTARGSLHRKWHRVFAIICHRDASVS
jgi:hypothetical protein